MRFKNLALLTLLITSPALGGAEVCVNNYLSSGINPCERGLPNFAYLLLESDPDQVVCGRIYDDSNCKNAPDAFDPVYTTDREIVCTVDFNNPPYSASCGTSPDQYDWVTAVYPD